MALVSPGLQLSVTDESQYVPGAVGSVPLIVLATAQDKTNPSGTSATGTTATNAGKLKVFTSQRELVSAFGYPTFQQSSAGTPLHGDERNEYGLMAAYSTLGVGNRVYAIRADVDLAQLEPTSVRPVGTVANGTNWLDLAATDWGVYEWNQTTGEFTKKTPIVITSSNDVDGSYYPNASLGSIGGYAVALNSATGGGYAASNWRLFYKNRSNEWTLVGDADWKVSNYTVKGTVTDPTIAASSPAAQIDINGHTVTVGSTSVSKSVTEVAASINAASITGVSAAAVDGKLEIYATDAATDGQVDISNHTGTPLLTLGITEGDAGYAVANKLAEKTKVAKRDQVKLAGKATAKVTDEA